MVHNTSKAHKYQQEKSLLCWRGCKMMKNNGTFIVGVPKNTGILAEGVDTDTGDYRSKNA